MTMTDPIADMLTRVRNAIMVGHSYVVVPGSKMKLAIARIMKDEGFIENYELTRDRPQPMIRIWLKYAGDRKNRRSAITGLKRISKPGRRVYKGKQEIPWVLSGMGIAVLSTSRGVMTGKKARRLGIGGEVLCHIW
jgi:small subunit ribosomal protein S8